MLKPHSFCSATSHNQSLTTPSMLGPHHFLYVKASLLHQKHHEKLVDNFWSHISHNMMDHCKTVCNGSLLPAHPWNQSRTHIESTHECVLPNHNTPISISISISLLSQHCLNPWLIVIVGLRGPGPKFRVSCTNQKNPTLPTLSATIFLAQTTVSLEAVLGDSRARFMSMRCRNEEFP